MFFRAFVVQSKVENFCSAKAHQVSLVPYPKKKRRKKETSLPYLSWSFNGRHGKGVSDEIVIVKNGGGFDNFQRTGGAWVDKCPESSFYFYIFVYRRIERYHEMPKL